MDSTTSLQRLHAPDNHCFGCGMANERGLKLESFASGESANSEVVGTWHPQPHHEAFDNVLNGGIIATLLDCHSTWTAVWHIMKRDDRERAPVCVTADFHVKLEAPTPTDRPVKLTARVVESKGRWITVEAELRTAGSVTATCRGHFVAVSSDHRAHGAW